MLKEALSWYACCLFPACASGTARQIHVTSGSSSLQSPGYPYILPEYLTCNWVITTLPGQAWTSLYLSVCPLVCFFEHVCKFVCLFVCVSFYPFVLILQIWENHLNIRQQFLFQTHNLAVWQTILVDVYGGCLENLHCKTHINPFPATV